MGPTEPSSCELFEPATQTAFAAGNPGAAMMLAGEHPGDAEEQRGVPLVGPAGCLRQQVLDEAGIERSTVYVMHAVKHVRFGRGASGGFTEPRWCGISSCGLPPDRSATRRTHPWSPTCGPLADACELWVGW